MAKFTLGKGGHEEEEIPDESGTPIAPIGEISNRPGTSRRLIILVGIGVLLIGGWYLANQLFIMPSPPPQVPAGSPMSAPTATTPPAAPTKEQAPAPPLLPSKPAGQEETKSGVRAKPSAPPPAGPGKAEDSKAAAPEKASVAPKMDSKPGLRTMPAPAVSFSLQLGAMVLEENAERLKQKLNDSGIPSAIRKATAFVTKQIVTVGEPTGRREAEELERRLNVDGFPSELQAIGGKYTPQVGAFFNLDEAIDLARELQRKNYSPKITSKPANTVVFQVRHGRFDSRSAALKRGSELKAKGFNFLVVRD